MREYKSTAENNQYILLRNDIETKSGLTKWKQLKKCQAWYTEYKGMIFLMSYETIVAVYNPVANILISYGRYSRTTYQHIRKFRNECCGGYKCNERNIEFENWFKEI